MMFSLRIWDWVRERVYWPFPWGLPRGPVIL